jgi:hypothetical protein
LIIDLIGNDEWLIVQYTYTLIVSAHPVIMLVNCNFANIVGRNFWRLGIITLSIALINFCSSESVKASDSQEKLAQSSQDYPLVESANLDTNLNVPWSQPVKIKDSFEGESIGIFDRHFFYNRILDTEARVEVVSLWSPDSIRFLLAYSDRDCRFSSSFYSHAIGSDCLTSNAALKITDVYLKIGEDVFRLEGKNSRFTVDDKLANALKNSPSKNVNLRLIVENGEAVDSEIGKETVKAWKAIY